MKKLLHILKDPSIRPVEIWLARILLAYVAAKLGLNVVKGAK